MYTYIYIYICAERERETEQERQGENKDHHLFGAARGRHQLQPALYIPVMARKCMCQGTHINDEQVMSQKMNDSCRN